MAEYAVYYYSSTGNSLAVALHLTERLGCSDPISIPGTMALQDPYRKLKTADKVGFVFPVRRGSIPDVLHNFLKGMPPHPATYHFAIATKAIFGCNEFWDIDELLREKGSFLNYAVALNMPGSVGFVSRDLKRVESALDKAQLEFEEIPEDIANSKENSYPRSVKLFGTASRAFSKYRRDKISFIVNDRCDGCGTCVQVCPVQNISITDGGRGEPVHSGKCIACLACIHWCPSKALHTRVQKVHSSYHHPKIQPHQLNQIPKDHPHAPVELALSDSQQD
jgi:ferredoxin/flavodoxin